MRKLGCLLVVLLFAGLLVPVFCTNNGLLGKAGTLVSGPVAQASEAKSSEESSEVKQADEGGEAVSEEGAGEEGVAEGEAAKEGAAAEEGQEEHTGPPPFMYFMQWLILISTFGLGLGYLVTVRTKGRSRHEGLRLAYALTILVFLFFALNYYPSITEYHEPGTIGFLKFLLLLLTGALITFYGVLGRHEEH
jgi:hypothetical protein